MTDKTAPSQCSTRPWVFFDFDDTLIEGDSLLYWLCFYYRRRPWRRVFQCLNLIAILFYGLRIFNSVHLKRVLFLPMAYEKKSDRESLARAFVKEDLIRFFYPSILERMWAHYFLNHQVVIVSASALFYLQYVQEILRPCSAVIGTRFDFPEKGWIRFPRVVEGNVKGKHKIRFISRHRGPQSSGQGCFSYSDHHSDRFLLEYTEFPSCVQPTSRLKKIAAPLGWPHIPIPHTRKHWETSLHKLILLLLAWSPLWSRKSLRPGVVDLIEGQVSETSLEEHFFHLKKRVLNKYREDEHQDVIESFFPKR